MTRFNDTAPNLAAALELDTVLRLLAEQALAEHVKARCLALKPAEALAEAERRMEETTQARRIIEHTGTPPLAAMPELQKALDLSSIGALLTPEQLAQVSVFLTTCRRMKGYLQKAELTGADIAGYGGSIADLADLEEEIERCVRNGQVDDRASSLLYDLRRGIAAKGEQIRAKLDALLRKNRAWFSESFVSVRNGRYTLPVKREYRASVSGSLIEMSGSGGTCFIEPASVQKLHDELAELRVEEDSEVRRVLYSLSAAIAERMPEIRLNIEAMEELDFLFAKAKLSLAMQASPARLTGERALHILSARHPLLDAAVAVPLNFYLRPSGEAAAGVVITGPNTGGKTVALKTVGLLSLMAQSGLHVPVDPRSVFAMQDGVYCDIGDGQSITENLSTFSAHLLSILRILRAAGPRSLVLLDELGSGTDPAEGMGIAVAVLDELRAKGCLFVATTHYPEIKDYAARTPGLVNARMAFDRESLRPLYRLEIGVAGESCALYIAERLGMPEHMLARARKAAGSETAKVPHTPQCEAAPMPPEPEPLPMSVEAFPPPPEMPPPIAAREAPAEPASLRFHVGDSVTLPGGEIGIVYAEANARGEVGVQVHGKKVLVNHKRLALKVAAAELYPDDYDLSIVLDTVANRKARHLMDKRHEAGNVVVLREGK